MSTQLTRTTRWPCHIRDRHAAKITNYGWSTSRTQLREQLAEIRERGWVLTDQELANGIRSIAAPLRDGAGRTRAALNVAVHAAETTTEKLVDEHLPRLLSAAQAINADWARLDALPMRANSTYDA